MDKTVRKVKNSLKFRAEERKGIVSVRIGNQRFILPVMARVLDGEDYIFFSLKAVSDLYKKNGNSLLTLPDTEDGAEAFKQLNPGRVSRKSKHNPEIQRLEKLLQKEVPEGFKVSYDKDGNIKLVKRRPRRAKNS
ncbi:MAG: hypothetical protein ACK4P3_07900 [Fimbriimonadaceae bacterium]